MEKGKLKENGNIMGIGGIIHQEEIIQILKCKYIVMLPYHLK